MKRTTLGGKVFRAALWVAFGLFFLFPLYAMADFSTRNLIAGGRTMQAWQNLVADEALYQSIVISLLLAVFTVVAMLLMSRADDDLGAAAHAVGQGHGGVPVPASPYHPCPGDRGGAAQRLSVGDVLPR